MTKKIFEARNPKQIRMTNKQQDFKQIRFGFGILDFPDLRFILAPFVSNFDIRFSDLVVWHLSAKKHDAESIRV